MFLSRGTYLSRLFVHLLNFSLRRDRGDVNWTISIAVVQSVSQYSLQEPYLIRISSGSEYQTEAKMIPHLRTKGLKAHTLFRVTYRSNPHSPFPRGF